MPTKGTKLRTGDRLVVVTPKFYRKFLKENEDIEITYAQFSKVIQECNDLLGVKVIDNTLGVRLPENMGYLAVTRYKSKRRNVDYKKTKELGQTIYHTNFHSYGYNNRIQWFSNQITICKFHQIYKFIPERKVSRDLAKRSFAGKVYNEYSYQHFKNKKLRVKLDKKVK